MRIQRAAMTCWNQQRLCSQQRLCLIAALRPPRTAGARNRQVFLEWRRLTAQYWTFRRCLQRTLQPLILIQLQVSLLRASWQGWHDTTKRSSWSIKQKQAVGAWACSRTKRQAVADTKTLLYMVLRCWLGFTRHQASRRRLQLGLCAKADRTATRKAMKAWQRHHQEQANLQHRECQHMSQVLHSWSQHVHCGTVSGVGRCCAPATAGPDSQRFC